jgi:putative PIN family toxin of toxin-antitoxin system
MIRVVFDTNILYSAIRQPLGFPAKAVDLAAAGLVIPCISDALLDEYNDVLNRPGLDLHAGRRRGLLDLLVSLALHVDPTEPLNISNDEDDNRIYECAAAGMADYIVTGNAKHFKKPYKTTRIVTARQLVELLHGEQQP